MEHTTLYRFFDKDDRLLYVGITKNYMTRLTNHIQSKNWIQQAVRCEFEHFDTREEASNAEIDAVQFENPIHNKQYASEREKHLAAIIKHLKGDEVADLDEMHLAFVASVKKIDEELGIDWLNENERWDVQLHEFLARTFDHDVDYHSIPCRLCARNYDNPTHRVESGFAEIDNWPHFYNLIKKHYEETGEWLGKRVRK
jgi:predicted GIY-YIG superfamily endonuclease